METENEKSDLEMTDSRAILYMGYLDEKYPLTETEIEAVYYAINVLKNKRDGTLN